MRQLPDQTALVRRTDVGLRARFPYLDTQIFEVTPRQYVIVFDRERQAADEIAAEFDHSIRPVTVPVALSNDVPERYVRRIEKIADADVAKGFEGAPFTAFDIKNYLASRHPTLPLLLSIGDHDYPHLALTFPRALTIDETSVVKQTLEALMPGWIFDIVVDAAMSTPQLTADALRIVAAKLRSTAPTFVRSDEDFFWSNIDGIFEGRQFPRQGSALNNIGIACYVDGSVFPNVDLRQLLFLFDTILLSPPLFEGKVSSFWQSQVLSREDALRLVEAGRLRLILRQPEERTDIRWLEEVHERSGTAILGRLSGGAAFAADLVSTANEYTLAAPSHRKAVTTIARQLASDFKLPERELLDLLLWPVGARLRSPEEILDRGLMASASLGLGRIAGDQIQRETGKDMRLEAIAAADGVHIAHVLNATLIAPANGLISWQPVQEAMAQRLNFYRGFNNRIAAAWAISERRKESRKSILPPLPLFEFNKHASVDDLLELSARPSLRFAGRALISHLCQLPEEERVAEIVRLEKELYAQNISRERRRLSIDTADAAVGVANDILSWGLWPVTSALTLVMRLIATARKNSSFDTFADVLERDIGGLAGRNADLDFLDKINRVAVLQTPTR